jgi:hypothetical protein
VWHNFVIYYLNEKINNMRKLLMIFAVTSVFAACNNKETDLETTKDVVVTDTSSMYNSNVSTDTGTTITTNVAPPAAAPTTIIRERTVYVDKTPKTTTKKSVPQTQTNTGTGTTTTNTGTGTTTTTDNGAGTTTTTTTPAPKEKEGMSSATKGAVIGGVGGAIGGAVLSKKKGKGAIIGGVIGAAGGYILGKKKDKADTTR